MGNSIVLEIQPYTVNYNPLDYPYCIDGAIYRLRQYLVEVLEGSVKLWAIDNYVDDPIYDYSYYMMEALWGG